MWGIRYTIVKTSGSSRWHVLLRFVPGDAIGSIRSVGFLLCTLTVVIEIPPRD